MIIFQRLKLLKSLGFNLIGELHCDGGSWHIMAVDRRLIAFHLDSKGFEHLVSKALTYHFLLVCLARHFVSNANYWTDTKSTDYLGAKVLSKAITLLSAGLWPKSSMSFLFSLFYSWTSFYTKPNSYTCTHLFVQKKCVDTVLYMQLQWGVCQRVLVFVF